MAFNPTNRPDVYVIDASTKGLAFEKLREFGVVGDDPHGRKRDATLIELFTHQGFLKRCVKLIGYHVTNMPYDVCRKGTDDVLFTNEDPMPPELEWLDLETLLFKWAASAKLMGAYYGMKEYTGGRISGLRYWNPTTVEPEFTGSGISHFKRRVNNRLFEIDPELVVYGFEPDPFVEQGPGSSDARAVRMNAQFLYDLDKYGSDQLRSGLPRKTVFVADPKSRPPDDKEKNRILHKIKRYFMGAEASLGEVLVGMKPEQVGQALSDLESEVLTLGQQRSTAIGMGIPPGLVLSNENNYATAQAEQVNLQTGNIIPLWRMFERTANPRFFDELDMYVKARPERLEVMQTHELEKAEKVMALTGGRPVFTRSMAAGVLGYEYTPQDIQELAMADELLFRQVGVDTTATPDQAKRLDLERWQKAIKNRGRDYNFSPDALSRTEADVIRERLAAKMPLDKVFDPPFADF